MSFSDVIAPCKQCDFFRKIAYRIIYHGFHTNDSKSSSAVKDGVKSTQVALFSFTTIETLRKQFYSVFNGRSTRRTETTGERTFSHTADAQLTMPTVDDNGANFALKTHDTQVRRVISGNFRLMWIGIGQLQWRLLFYTRFVVVVSS